MRPSRSRDRLFSASRPTFTIFMVALLVLSTVGAYAVLFALPEGKVAGVGDKVRVDYIGKFDDGRVFDTSLWSVASDEGEPKSLFFSMRGGEDSTSPSSSRSVGTAL